MSELVLALRDFYFYFFQRSPIIGLHYRVLES